MRGHQSERNAPCQGCQGVEGVSRGRQKPTQAEPHLWPITAACPAYVECFIKAHRCGAHLHKFSLSLIFTCRLSVVTLCESAHMLPSALICALFFSLRSFVKEVVMLTADGAKRFLLYVACRDETSCWCSVWQRRSI